MALGGSVLSDLNERVLVEGQGTYLDRGAGANAFTVGGGLLVNLVRSRERVVSYAVLGGCVLLSIVAAGVGHNGASA